MALVAHDCAMSAVVSSASKIDDQDMFGAAWLWHKALEIVIASAAPVSVHVKSSKKCARSPSVSTLRTACVQRDSSPILAKRASGCAQGGHPLLMCLGFLDVLSRVSESY
jgi:hypothetical protein